MSLRDGVYIPMFLEKLTKVLTISIVEAKMSTFSGLLKSDFLDLEILYHFYFFYH